MEPKKSEFKNVMMFLIVILVFFGMYILLSSINDYVQLGIPEFVIDGVNMLFMIRYFVPVVLLKKEHSKFKGTLGILNVSTSILLYLVIYGVLTSINNHFHWNISTSLMVTIYVLIIFVYEYFLPFGFLELKK